MISPAVKTVNIQCRHVDFRCICNGNTSLIISEILEKWLVENGSFDGPFSCSKKNLNQTLF